MGGLAAFSLIGLYIFAGYKFVKSIRPGYRKWLAIVVLALIPTADAIVGRIYLQHLCATEGGLKVYRVAQGVEGFMSDSREVSGMYVEKYGYKFSEGAPVNGLVNRYSKNNGQIIKEKDVLPKSKYRLRALTTEEKNIYMKQALIVETFPGAEVLAIDTQIGFNGGWAERFLGGFSDAGSGRVWCDREITLVRRYREIIASSLKR